MLTMLALAAVISLGLYHLKQEVMRLEARMTAVNKAILVEQEAVRVLRAEWSYLNQPERLDELAVRHLGLAPLALHQIGTVLELPLRRPAVAIPLPRPPAIARAAPPRAAP